MKELMFVGYFKEVWEELVQFLEVKEYGDKKMVEHLKELLESKDK